MAGEPMLTGDRSTGKDNSTTVLLSELVTQQVSSIGIMDQDVFPTTVS